MTNLEIAYLIILAFCILGSGFFSGSETALVSVPRERVLQLLETDKRAARVANLIADSDRMLSTLLVGNNLVNILGASVATVLFIDLLGEDWGPWVATASVTSVVLLIGEITPKNLATRFPEKISLLVAPTIWNLSRVLHPVTRLFLAMSRGLFRLFGVDPSSGPAPITEDDIRVMAALGEREGDIEAAERDIIHAVFVLADRQVREVMTPRTDIVTLDDPVSIADVRAAVSASGHSRFPVIETDLDDVVGVLHVKDLLRMPGEASEADIRRALREPTYVPETKPLMELLHEMRARRRAFALVLDEHGGVEGLITIKDIVSELVGELRDEFDPSVPAVVATATGHWAADGRVPVDDLDAELGVRFPEGPYTTVAGLVLDLAGRIPQEGDAVESCGYRLTVTAMDRNRIDRVQIERLQDV
ncbi:MAG: hemolysin family protein [Actinobacteria bacterium]|nr:hemolysin family protein [Actinomycetota bacterium]MBU1492386.1 hemolysin family protein [Actinomycetota bacterium]